MLLQPEQHVGLAAHRADLDHLVEAEEMRGHTAVNGISELEIILSKGFDERGGVNACRGAKGIMADDRIIGRNHRVGGLRDFLAILLEPGQVLLDKVHEAKIDEH